MTRFAPLALIALLAACGFDGPNLFQPETVTRLSGAETRSVTDSPRATARRWNSSPPMAAF